VGKRFDEKTKLLARVVHLKAENELRLRPKNEILVPFRVFSSILYGIPPFSRLLPNVGSNGCSCCSPVTPEREKIEDITTNPGWDAGYPPIVSSVPQMVSTYTVVQLCRERHSVEQSFKIDFDIARPSSESHFDYHRVYQSASIFEKLILRQSFRDCRSRCVCPKFFMFL